MKMRIVALGVVLLAGGVATAVLLRATNILGGRTHQIGPAGGIGLAVVGGIVATPHSTSKSVSTSWTIQCQSCGSTLGLKPPLNHTARINTKHREIRPSSHDHRLRILTIVVRLMDGLLPITNQRIPPGKG